MIRNALVVILLATAAPVLAMDLPTLTFPDTTPVTTSTANGK